MLFSHLNNRQSKILVVDDEPTSLLVMTEALGDLGEVIGCASGVEALGVAFSFRPDIILLDIEMPNMNGFEVCKAIKQNPLTALSIVIFVTSHNEQIFEYQSLKYHMEPEQVSIALNFSENPLSVHGHRNRHHIRYLSKPSLTRL